MTNEKLALILPEINKNMTPDIYCTEGKRYSVYNIYFDNDTNDIIRHSVSSPYYKEKLRLRSYFEYPKSEDSVFMEIKKKTGKIVSKRRAILTYEQSKEYIYKNIIPKESAYMQKQVLCEINYFINTYKVKPAVYICYDRYAFFGNEDNTFRLTIDSNIRSRRNNLSFDYGSAGTKIIDDNQCLMEIKISGAIPLWLVKIISRYEIYSTSFSKYGQEYQKQKTFEINNDDSIILNAVF